MTCTMPRPTLPLACLQQPPTRNLCVHNTVAIAAYSLRAHHTPKARLADTRQEFRILRPPATVTPGQPRSSPPLPLAHHPLHSVAIRHCIPARHCRHLPQGRDLPWRRSFENTPFSGQHHTAVYIPCRWQCRRSHTPRLSLSSWYAWYLPRWCRCFSRMFGFICSSRVLVCLPLHAVQPCSPVWREPPRQSLYSTGAGMYNCAWRCLPWFLSLGGCAFPVGGVFGVWCRVVWCVVYRGWVGLLRARWVCACVVWGVPVVLCCSLRRDAH